MRKDKPTMKTILENARAMRTASLSGRKNTQKSPNNYNPIPSESSQSKSFLPYQSQSQVIRQSPNYNLQRNPYYNNLSYQFNQGNAMVPNYMNNYPIHMPYNPYQSINLSNFSQNFSQMSQMSQPNESFTQSKPHLQQKTYQEREREKAQKILQLIKYQMQKNFNSLKQPIKMKNMLGIMQSSMNQFKCKSQFNLMKLFQH